MIRVMRYFQTALKPYYESRQDMMQCSKQLNPVFYLNRVVLRHLPMTISITVDSFPSLAVYSKPINLSSYTFTSNVLISSVIPETVTILSLSLEVDLKVEDKFWNEVQQFNSRYDVTMLAPFSYLILIVSCYLRSFNSYCKINYDLVINSVGNRDTKLSIDYIERSSVLYCTQNFSLSL